MKNSKLMIVVGLALLLVGGYATQSAPEVVPAGSSKPKLSARQIAKADKSAELARRLAAMNKFKITETADGTPQFFECDVTGEHHYTDAVAPESTNAATREATALIKSMRPLSLPGLGSAQDDLDALVSKTLKIQEAKEANDFKQRMDSRTAQRFQPLFEATMKVGMTGEAALKILKTWGLVISHPNVSVDASGRREQFVFEFVALNLYIVNDTVESWQFISPK